MFRNHPPRISIDEALASEDPITEVGIRLAHLSPDEFTDAEELFGGVLSFFADTMNGGFHQTFFNSTGEHMARMERFATEYCSPELSKILSSVRGLFPGGVIPEDRGERNDVLDSIAPDIDLFDPLDWEFYEHEDEIVEGMRKLLRTKRNEFENIRSVGA